MKILALSLLFPYPPRQGKSERRTYNFLKYLNETHSVTLLTQVDEETSLLNLKKLRESVDEVVIFPKSSQKDQRWLEKVQQWGTFISLSIPPNILAVYEPDIQTWLDEQIKINQFDIITCEGSLTEIYIRSHWQNLLPTIMNIHRSIYGVSQYKMEHQISKRKITEQLKLPLLRRYEQKYCAKFSSIVTMTYEDQRTLKTLDLEVPITAIPNGIDLTQYPKRSANCGGQRIILMGAMDKPANIDAARFFSLEVFPLLQQRYPDAILEIVGLRMTQQVSELGQYSKNYNHRSSGFHYRLSPLGDSLCTASASPKTISKWKDDD